MVPPGIIDTFQGPESIKKERRYLFEVDLFLYEGFIRE
jgi:hypothetical protein